MRFLDTLSAQKRSDALSLSPAGIYPPIISLISLDTDVVTVSSFKGPYSTHFPILMFHPELQ